MSHGRDSSGFGYMYAWEFYRMSMYKFEKAAVRFLDDG